MSDDLPPRDARPPLRLFAPGNEQAERLRDDLIAQIDRANESARRRDVLHLDEDHAIRRLISWLDELLPACEASGRARDVNEKLARRVLKSGKTLREALRVFLLHHKHQ